MDRNCEEEFKYVMHNKELYMPAQKDTSRAESLLSLGLLLTAKQCAVVVVELSAVLRFNNREPRRAVLAGALVAAKNHSVLAEIAFGARLLIWSIRQSLCCFCGVFWSPSIVDTGLLLGSRSHNERKSCGNVGWSVLRKDFAHKLAAVVAYDSTASNGDFGL